MTAPTTVRPMKLEGDSGDLKEMTNSEIGATLHMKT